MFEDCRTKIINFYNNKFHRLIKTTPNLAYKITDPEKIKKINEIKNKEFEKINRKRSYLEKKDLCLLNPKFLKIGKSTLIFNKVKKVKYNEKIPVRILNNSSFGYYLIKIESNFKIDDIDVKRGEEYVADVMLLKKINDNAWNAIVSNRINDSKIKTKYKEKKKKKDRKKKHKKN